MMDVDFDVVNKLQNSYFKLLNLKLQNSLIYHCIDCSGNQHLLLFKNMKTIIDILSGISAVFLFVVFYSLLLGGPIWLLWNWLMPTIFGLTKITFYQAIGLNILSSILFKSNINTYKKK